MRYYEGQKKTRDNYWIVIVGRRENKDEVIELIRQDQNRDHNRGLSSEVEKYEWRVVTWERIESELVK